MYDLFSAPVGNGYGPELSPGRLAASLLLRNVDPGSSGCGAAEAGGRSPRCLVIGPGDGLSAVFHAASLPGEWWLAAPDADQALAARELAGAAGAELHIAEAGPAELGRSASLPDFDLILAPGVWSAGGEADRTGLLALTRRRLRPGGALLVTYDVLPGCGELMPLRDLLLLHSLMTGSPSEPKARRTERALAHLTALAGAGAALFREAPQRGELLRRLSALPAGRLRLLFEPTWRPWYFADVERSLAPARLVYAGSVRLLHSHDALCASRRDQMLLCAADPALRETARDALINTRHRADIFVKGLRMLTLEKRIRAVSRLTVALTRALEDVPLALDSPVPDWSGLPAGAGRPPVRLHEELYGPLLAVLAERNYAPRSVEELEDHPLLHDVDSASLLEMLSVLMGAGLLHPCVDAALRNAAACRRLNARLEERAAADANAAWLVSPVLGTGVAVSRPEQLFLRSMRRAAAAGKDWSPEDGGADAWIALSSHGERLRRDGIELSFAEAEQAVIELAGTFAQRRLPLLAALGIAPDSPLTGS